MQSISISLKSRSSPVPGTQNTREKGSSTCLCLTMWTKNTFAYPIGEEVGKKHLYSILGTISIPHEILLYLHNYHVFISQSEIDLLFQHGNPFFGQYFRLLRISSFKFKSVNEQVATRTITNQDTF